MKKIFVTIMTLAAAIFQMQAVEDASVSIQLESDNNRTSVVTINQAAIYTANEQNATEMLAQITNTTTAVNIYAMAPYGKMAIMGSNYIRGTYVGFTTNSRTNYTLTFGGVTGSQLYLIDHGVNPIHVEPIVENGVYPFTAAASSTIEDRFEIGIPAPTVQLYNEWDNNWTTPLNFTDNYDGTVSASKTFTGNGYCPFKIVEDGNWLGNGDAFKRDYTSATGINNNDANMTLWVDVPGEYTFTWNYETNALSITMPALPTVQMKGSWDSWADFVDFTPAADGLTASANLHLDPADWYNFQMIIADEWRGFTWVDDNSNFTRTNNSHDWINAGTSADMNLHADVAGDYTFTWTYVENKLTITFPAVAPANTVTTNSNGFLSFASTEDVEFLGGLKAYRGQYNAGTNELTLYEIGTKVPANTGVILWNSNGTAETFNYTTGADVSGVTVGTNNFVGVTTAADPAGIRAAGKEIYCLNGNALKQYVGTDDIPAGKAYLPISVGGGSNNAPKHITMRFNNTTAVDNLDVEAGNVEKFIENGQIYIRRGNEVFNMQGQIVK